MAEAFLDHADAQALDAAAAGRGVARGLHAALAGVDAVRPGDDFEQQRVVAHVGGHRPAVSSVISSGAMPV